MANNFRGNVIRDIVIRGTVIRANDFRGTDPYPGDDNKLHFARYRYAR
jgi:hypothetical protein